MITPELVTYIKNERAKGLADDTIKAALLSQGWTEADFREAVDTIMGIKVNTAQVSKGASPELKAYRRQKKWIIFMLEMVCIFLYWFAVSINAGADATLRLFMNMSVFIVVPLLAAYLSAWIVSIGLSPRKTSAGEFWYTVGFTMIGLIVCTVIGGGLFFVTCIAFFALGGLRL